MNRKDTSGYGTVEGGEFKPNYYNALYCLLTDAAAAGTMKAAPEEVELYDSVTGESAVVKIKDALDDEEMAEIDMACKGATVPTLALMLDSLRATAEETPEASKAMPFFNEISEAYAKNDEARAYDAAKKLLTLINTASDAEFEADFALPMIVELVGGMGAMDEAREMDVGFESDIQSRRTTLVQEDFAADEAEYEEQEPGGPAPR